MLTDFETEIQSDEIIPKEYEDWLQEIYKKGSDELGA